MIRPGSFVLNSYFVNDIDNYMKGRISYPLSGLSEGDHSLTLKAWDNLIILPCRNNYLPCGAGDKFMLKNLLNYPNPFFDSTRYTAEHNRPGSELKVIINIYNMNGKIIIGSSAQKSLQMGMNCLLFHGMAMMTEAKSVVRECIRIR